MGDCYFIRDFYQNRGELVKGNHRKKYVIPSESLGSIIENTESFLPMMQKVNDKTRREFQRLINGTIGIWFYESDLWNKQLLKEKLSELIKEIDDIA